MRMTRKSDGTTVAGASGGAAFAAGWNKVTAWGRAPATAVYVIATITSGTSKVWIDDIDLRRHPPAGPIVDFVSQTFSAGLGMAIDCAQADHWEMIWDNASGLPTFIGAPSNPYLGMELTVKIKNISGGAVGAYTWPGSFKMSAWVNPAATFSRSIVVRYDGTNWIECARTPNDVPN
ncbi:MAG: hypothetical protein ABR567_09475 [Myxococcales bacterium]